MKINDATCEPDFHACYNRNNDQIVRKLVEFENNLQTIINTKISQSFIHGTVMLKLGAAIYKISVSKTNHIQMKICYENIYNVE